MQNTNCDLSWEHCDASEGKSTISCPQNGEPVATSKCSYTSEGGGVDPPTSVTSTAATTELRSLVCAMRMEMHTRLNDLERLCRKRGSPRHAQAARRSRPRRGSGESVSSLGSHSTSPTRNSSPSFTSNATTHMRAHRRMRLKSEENLIKLVRKKSVRSIVTGAPTNDP